MNFPDRYILCIIAIYNPNLIILNDLLVKLNNKYIQTIIIDNSNCDEFLDLNNKGFFDLTYERLDRNIGLPAAQNYAVNKYSTLRNNFIIFFDQDSSISEETIPNLLNNYSRLKNAGHNVGAVGPLLFDKAAKCYYPVFSDHSKKVIHIQNEADPIKVSYLISSGTLIKRDTLLSTGLMLPEYFIDYSDIEWCFRLSYNNFEIYVIPSSVMYHSPGDTIISIFGKILPYHSPYRKYYQARNLFHMLRLRHVPSWWKRKEIVSLLYKSIIYFLHTNYKIKFLKYLFMGLFDGFRSKFRNEVV